MSQLKKLAGETAIYGVSSILGRMLNYLLVPIYTSFFVAAEYGVVTEMYAYVAFFNVLYTYGLETAYFRFASAEKNNEQHIFNVSISSIFVSSIFFSLVLMLFATPIVNYLEYPGKEHYITLFALILASDAIMAIPFAKLRLEKKAKLFAVAKLINIGLTIILNLFFIVFCKYVYEGKLFPQLQPWINSFYDPSLGIDYVFVSNLIANLILVFVLWRTMTSFKFNLQWPSLKKLLKYSYPLLFMGLAGVTNEMLSRVMLKKMLPDNFYGETSNQAALGIFGAAYKLSVFMALTIQAFRYAAEPFFFSNAKEKNSPQLFSKVMHWFIIVCCFILLSISLNLDIIGPLFLRSPEYQEGLIIVPVLLLATMFLGIYYNLSIWFKLTDKTQYGTWISWSGAAITIIINILLIPVLGYFGSALVTLVCYFYMAFVCYYYGQKYYPIPYKMGTALLYIIGTMVVIYAMWGIKISNPWLAISIHAVPVVLFVVIVVVTEKIKVPKII